ncbi:cytochrome C [Sulfitobacter alexandrii]|uniref:Cytochrome C n=1 Tax=Sulfitobacter alexandrii TaxID=1917485 RepID=A0A1J0WK96_9RHOB|nr:cytochrome c [Sulfitobacter alexandrii]APE44600.1 cytochrome C [Sulfitobacter alexandrii]
MRAFILVLVLAAPPSFADHLFEGRDIAAGAALYAEKCAACHGADLQGQPDWRTPGADGVLPAPPHDVTGHTWHHDTPMLMAYTLDGGQATLEARGVTGFKSGMPAFRGTLSEDDVLDILAYIRASWPAEAQEVQRQRTHGAD